MSVWPLPTERNSQSSAVVWLSKDLTLDLTNGDEEGEKPWATGKLDIDSEDVIQGAFDRMRTAAFTQNIVPNKFHPRGESFEPKVETTRVQVREISILQGPEPKGEEGYGLELHGDGQAIITASDYKGALHALTTFSQLFYQHSEGAELVYSPIAPVSILDKPSFTHRGLSLDIARNRISTEAVKRVLEAMSLSKLNRLHLHAWDSQSWPIEIPALPELAAKGTYHESQIWKVNDLEGVQKYGVERGIEVYFDADMPGHTASIHHAYPDLITGYNKQPWEPWCLEPPSGQLKLNSPKVSKFLQTLFDDLVPRVAKHSFHLQVGGEEINKKIYELDDTVGSSSRDVLKSLLQNFFDEVTSQALKHNLQPIVWEEALLEWDLAFPRGTVFQAWKSEESLPKIVAKGYPAIAGTHTHWYLDGGFGGWVDPDPSNFDTPVRPPYPDWDSPYKNWRQVLSYDPLSGVPDEHRYLVMGGEVFLWCETVDEANLDTVLWPRVCAAAEVLWRGKGEVCEESTRRLAQMRERLVARGYGAAMVQMEWCLQNPGNAQL